MNEDLSRAPTDSSRRRCRPNEVRFKMGKWIALIALVQDFANLGVGEGGYNEDHEFYGYRVPI